MCREVQYNLKYILIHIIIYYYHSNHIIVWVWPLFLISCDAYIFFLRNTLITVDHCIQEKWQNKAKRKKTSTLIYYKKPLASPSSLKALILKHSLSPHMINLHSSSFLQFSRAWSKNLRLRLRRNPAVFLWRNRTLMVSSYLLYSSVLTSSV